jgi:hypothetical protein
VNADRLFLARCEQLRVMQDSDKEIEVLDSAKNLRQMLIDPYPLMDVVNAGILDIRFAVGKDHEDFIKRFGPGTELMYTELSGEGGIPENRVSLKKGRFLSHIVFVRKDQPITVRDVIMNSAVAAGGVHFDPKPKAQYLKTQSLLKSIYGWGLPMELHLLRDIAYVTVTGLQPLIEMVEKRVNSTS